MYLVQRQEIDERRALEDCTGCIVHAGFYSTKTRRFHYLGRVGLLCILQAMSQCPTVHSPVSSVIPFQPSVCLFLPLAFSTHAAAPYALAMGFCRSPIPLLALAHCYNAMQRQTSLVSSSLPGPQTVVSRSEHVLLAWLVTCSHSSDGTRNCASR